MAERYDAAADGQTFSGVRCARCGAVRMNGLHSVNGVVTCQEPCGEQPTDWIKDAGWFSGLMKTAQAGNEAEFDSMLRRLLYEHARTVIARHDADIAAAKAEGAALTDESYAEWCRVHKLGWDEGAAEVVARVEAALAEKCDGTQETEVSCGGFDVFDSGCFAQTLALKVRAALTTGGEGR